MAVLMLPRPKLSVRGFTTRAARSVSLAQPESISTMSCASRPCPTALSTGGVALVIAVKGTAAPRVAAISTIAPFGSGKRAAMVCFLLIARRAAVG
ncbi:hypothetical protein D3C80_1597410 [compost metagenome]